jgi:AAA domain
MSDQSGKIDPRCQQASPASPSEGHDDLLPNIIPYGSVSLLSGAAGLGKTAFFASLAKAFRDGTPIFGHQPIPIPEIGIIVADRGWERGARVWFERAGFPEIKVYSMPDDPHFDPRCLRKKYERTARFGEFIDKLAMVKRSLLFTDPISLFLGGNLLDYDTCAVACHEIRVLLRNRGLTLIASAHSGKLKADRNDRYQRLQDQILGSTALLGFSDTQMVLASPEETGQKHYTFMWLSHLAPPETFLMERDKQGIFTLADVDGSDATSAHRVLALFPPDGSETTLGQLTELAQAIPLTMKTVQRALVQLIGERRVQKVRRGTYRRVDILH